MLSKIVLKTHINFRFHVVLSLAWFLKSIWSIWWWIQNDNLAFYSWNAHFKNNIFSMWMMFAVRDGRLCTSRALEAFRKLAMMLLWGLQVWIFRGVAKHFPIFIMLSVPSLARIILLFARVVIPSWVSFTYFPYFLSRLLFTVLLKPLQICSFVLREQFSTFNF